MVCKPLATSLQGYLKLANEEIHERKVVHMNSKSDLMQVVYFSYGGSY